MSNLFLIIAFISFVALGVLVIMTIIQFVRKNVQQAKRFLKLAAGALAVMIISFVAFGITLDSEENADSEKVETSGPAESKDEIQKEPEVKEPEVTEEEKAEVAKKEAEEKAEAELIAKQEAEAKAEAEAQKKAEEEAKVKEASIPREHKAALKTAETYSETMNMSKEGIYDQLTSEYGEGFPAEAAQYAIDNIVVDWKENALESARTYAETMDMSDSAIYEQLISEYGEKFTADEAQYAIDNL